MSSLAKAFSTSVGKKFVMSLTGLFLISFLLVHVFLNSFIFINDGGLLFNEGAHFMATNWIIRSMEIVLFIGIIWHIVQALVLTIANRKARPTGYAVDGGAHNSKWYSRWMGLLGTLILIFLIIHLGDFWVKSRFTGLPGVDVNGHENLYAVMLHEFKELPTVILYVLSMISLGYHLLHGFQSAFQSLGWNHTKYTPIIKAVGCGLALIVPAAFAAMPLAIYFDVIK